MPAADSRLLDEVGDLVDRSFYRLAYSHANLYYADAIDKQF
ncbi:hypothetical protein [Nostoc sp.]